MLTAHTFIAILISTLSSSAGSSVLSCSIEICHLLLSVALWSSDLLFGSPAVLI